MNSVISSGVDNRKINNIVMQCPYCGNEHVVRNGNKYNRSTA
jgi:transposase-like protein